MQDHTTDQLYPVMLHAKNTLCRLSYRGKSLREEIIKRLTVFQSLFIFFRLSPELLIRQCLHIRSQCLDLINQWVNTLQFSLAVGSKDFLYCFHPNTPIFFS